MPLFPYISNGEYSKESIGAQKYKFFFGKLKPSGIKISDESFYGYVMCPKNVTTIWISWKICTKFIKKNNDLNKLRGQCD